MGQKGKVKVIGCKIYLFSVNIYIFYSQIICSLLIISHCVNVHRKTVDPNIKIVCGTFQENESYLLLCLGKLLRTRISGPLKILALWGHARSACLASRFTGKVTCSNLIQLWKYDPIKVPKISTNLLWMFTTVSMKQIFTK